MKQNMGTVDRLVRLAIAVIVGVLYLADVISGVLAIVLGVVALIFLVTGLVGVCPLYLLLNISTRQDG